MRKTLLLITTEEIVIRKRELFVDSKIYQSWEENNVGDREIYRYIFQQLKGDYGEEVERQGGVSILEIEELINE